MNTMVGFEGSPMTSVQIFVPSSDTTNLLELMALNVMGEVKGLEVSIIVAGVYIVRG